MKRSDSNLHAHVAGWQRGVWHALAGQGIPYTLHETVRTSQVLAMRLRLHDARQLSKALAMEEQLALALSASSVRMARHLGFLDIEIALPAAHHKTLPAGVLKRKGGTWVTLGQTAAGTPVHIQLTGSRTCHALIAGATGSGKTVAQHLVAWSLASDNRPDHVRLILIDGAKRGAAWYGFENEAHLAHPIIADSNEAVAALSWATAELDRRMEQARSLPLLFILIDEVRALLNLAGRDVAQAIEHIASIGREFGVHIIVATQHPLTDALGGSIAKANLTMRLTGRVADANAAYLATGVKGSGAERLLGNGDFLLTVAGETHRLQIALTDARDIERLPRSETTPRLDLDQPDLGRVLQVAGPGSPRKPVEDDPRAFAYALATECGVPTLRAQFGPMGTKRAQRIRDFAAAVREALIELGYTYPLPLRNISQETARRVGIDR